MAGYVRVLNDGRIRGDAFRSGSALTLLNLALILAGMLSTAMVSPAVADDAAMIVGIVTDTNKQPVAHATVTARNAKTTFVSVTGPDGVYAFSGLEPGAWSLSAAAPGYRALPPLALATSGTTRYDMTLVREAAAANVEPTATAAARGGGSASFFDRIWQPLFKPQLKQTEKPTVVAQNTAPTASAVPVPTTSTPAPVPAPTTPPPAQTATVPEALQQPAPAPANDTVTPFANDGYIGWMNGTTRENSPIFDTKFFTPEIRFDVNYLADFNHPKDHTIDGSTEEFRSEEWQVEQVSFGGNFHWNNVQARFLSMFGMFAVTTPRNDASYGVGQWDLQGAYKYFSEANAGYHFDVSHGLNVDAGIFVSYIGLFSYYNFDNWTYQPSFVSSNTPWFFNGLRIQWFPTQDLKIEPWLINGWQSYAQYNHHPGFGGQILWIPSDSLKMVFNSYSLGEDNVSSSGPYQLCNGSNPYAPSAVYNESAVQPNNVSCPANAPYVNPGHIQRIHEDDSLLWKYYDGHGENGRGISRMAMSLTWDVGCQYGGGVSCDRGPAKENFIGAMLYNRTWWDNNVYALTLGGGFYNNPGRYLALLPPINGATASSGTPYFSENPGEKLFQWDSQLNFQYMPNDWITWWTETTFRHSDVPYWTGAGGITPPNTQDGVQFGTQPGAQALNTNGSVWYPDLRTREVIWGAGVMVKW